MGESSRARTNARRRVRPLWQEEAFRQFLRPERPRARESAMKDILRDAHLPDGESTVDGCVDGAKHTCPSALRAKPSTCRSRRAS